MPKRNARRPIFRILALLSVIGFSPITSADEVRPFIIGGLAFGGENLISTTREDLDAGGLLYFGGGAIIEPVNSNLMFQVSMGYKVDSIDYATPSGGAILPGLGFVPGRTNGDSTISVIPLDFMAFLKADNLRFGAGLAYYLDPEWEICANGSGCATLNFDNALGVAFELRHQWTDILFWGARYTSVDYEKGSISVDANNLRIHFGMMF
jgi:hypothetical protein